MFCTIKTRLIFITPKNNRIVIEIAYYDEQSEIEAEVGTSIKKLMVTKKSIRPSPRRAQRKGNKKIEQGKDQAIKYAESE